MPILGLSLSIFDIEGATENLAGPGAGALLLETGDFLLLEDDTSKLIFE